MTIHLGLDTLAGDRLEPRGFAQLNAPLAGAGDDGLGQRMLGVLLSRGDEAQEIIFPPAAKSEDIREGGRSIGEGAGLVEDDGIYARDVLEGRCVFDQDVVPRTDTRADGHGGRGSQAQGVRASNNDRRDRERHGRYGRSVALVIAYDGDG